MLSDAMTRLPGWSGDPDGIHRHFDIDGDDRRRLVANIEALADLTGHPIAVEEVADGVDVALVSDDVSGVSEIDIALATRITDLASGRAALHIPQQRQADLNGPEPVAAYADTDGGERSWWSDRDTAEPVMGVPATGAGLMPIPLPDTAPREPEPGIGLEQEPRGGEPLGFGMRGAGDPPSEPE